MKVGIDLGGSHVSIGIVDDNAKIIEQVEKDFTLEEKLDIIGVAEKYIVDEVEKFKNKYEITKIGMAIPGTVKDGVIKRSVNLKIENYDIEKSLSNKLKMKLYTKNDAKCAAIAEYRYVGLEDKKNVIFLGLGTGIGGAAFYNGILLEGTEFAGFEFGHVVIKNDGIPCNCGKRGCFEQYGSMRVFKNKIKERLSLPDNISGPDLRAIIAQNNDKVIDIIEHYLSDVALGISNLINIFEPDAIILGGGFSRYDYMFLDRLNSLILKGNLLFNKRNSIDLRVAKLGNDAGIIGASLI